MRNFGIEVEFNTTRCGDDIHTVGTLMENKGLVFINRANYGHSDGVAWELKTDSSAGLEVASRVLNGNAGLQELEWYIQALDELRDQRGWKITRQCGFHVHIDLSDFSAEDFRRLVLMTIFYEPLFYAVHPDSRLADPSCHQFTRSIRNNSEFLYLAGLGETYRPNKIQSILERHRDSYPNRYFGLNIKNFITKGTVEFRYGGGTLNPNKVLGWSIFLLGFVEKVKASQRLRVPIGRGEWSLKNMKDRARKYLSSLKNVGLTYRVKTAHKNLDERFEKFTVRRNRADHVPNAVRGER